MIKRRRKGRRRRGMNDGKKRRGMNEERMKKEVKREGMKERKGPKRRRIYY
jgi:hypothetical protein